MIGSDVAGRRGQAWRRALSGLAGLGVLASAVVGYGWTASHQRSDSRRFEQTASGVAASLTSSLQRDLDFQAIVAERVATDPDLTNRELGPWFAGLDLTGRYPGTVGVGFVERVPAAGLASFDGALRADPEPGQPGGSGPVYPPGARAVYCLTRLGVLVRPIGIPPETDLCAPSWPGIGPSPLAPLMDASAGSGATVVASYPAFVSALRSAGRAVPASMAGSLQGLFMLVTPVYRGGADPATPAVRQARFEGWLVGTFSANTLVDEALGRQRGVAITAYAMDSGRPELVAIGGSAGRGASSFSERLDTNPPFMVEVTGSVGGDSLLTGVLLGLLGAIISGLPLALGLHLGRSREKALRLVEERTRELRHQAEHDPLTDLANRALLHEVAGRMLDQAGRSGRVVTATFIDLDDFKEVNDSLGHPAGDRLLRAVGERLVDAVGPGCVVGRIGGDEFLVLSMSDPSRAPHETAEKVLAALAETVPVDGGVDGEERIAVACSIGVASAGSGPAEDLIRNADIALYETKARGKAGFTVFESRMHAAIQERLAMAGDLRRSVADGDFFVVYQPITDLETGEVKGAEALVRWNHPRRGLIPPGQFIPVAEQNGVIAEIGNFVLDEACRQSAAWWRAGWRIGVAVNASALQIQDPTFVERVRRTLARHRLEPGVLTIEITESVLMRDTDDAYRTLAELHGLGVRLAIDDFGTGYSSLAYLQRFPIDVLKIDRSFVLSAGETAESRSLIGAFVQIGQALGLEVIAEGIEEPAQLRLLADRGCRRGQGYLFSRPLTGAQVEDLLRGGSCAPRAGDLSDRLT